MEVLKQENVMSTNCALCILEGCVLWSCFATGFAGGACTGLRAGSIMFLQGNNM